MIIEYEISLTDLPKPNKAGIQMYLIISGIGSASHKLAKAMRKNLTLLLSTIVNPLHIKNSGNLTEKQRERNRTDKTIGSLDLKLV